ncbi:hypothetical protein BJ085DRAFT_9432, partial [Dimargaris cristalligena]
LMKNLNAKSPYCHKQVTITWNGQSVEAMVTDTCPGCGEHDIDLGRAVAEEFGE